MNAAVGQHLYRVFPEGTPFLYTVRLLYVTSTYKYQHYDRSRVMLSLLTLPLPMLWTDWALQTPALAQRPRAMLLNL